MIENFGQLILCCLVSVPAVLSNKSLTITGKKLNRFQKTVSFINYMNVIQVMKKRGCYLYKRYISGSYNMDFTDRISPKINKNVNTNF